MISFPALCFPNPLGLSFGSAQIHSAPVKLIGLSENAEANATEVAVFQEYQDGKSWEVGTARTAIS